MRESLIIECPVKEAVILDISSRDFMIMSHSSGNEIIIQSNLILRYMVLII